LIINEINITFYLIINQLINKNIKVRILENNLIRLFYESEDEAWSQYTRQMTSKEK